MRIDCVLSSGKGSSVGGNRARFIRAHRRRNSNLAGPGLSLRGVLHNLPQHEVLPLERVDFCLHLRHLGLNAAPLILEGGHVRLFALASLLGRHAVPQEAFESFALLLILYVVVFRLCNFVRFRLFVPAAWDSRVAVRLVVVI